MSQIFNFFFQTGDINNFVLCGVFLSRYVQLKCFFYDEKTSAEKSETTALMQNCSDNANGDVPLTVENA